MSDPQILFEQRAGVGLLTLNRPEARNAITFEMYDEMARLCESIEPGGELRALVITGAGEKAFAAGTDISRFRDFTGGSDALAYERRIDSVLQKLEKVPVPTIAALRGACTGGGAAIAIACDLRVADEKLRFGFPIARTLGNCLSGSSLARVVGALGAARTKEMLFTARLMAADEALACGLLESVVSDPLARALSLAEQMSGHAPLTLRAIKEGMRRLSSAGGSIEDEDLILSCYESEDFREGMNAFFEKRAPRWQGR
jgi:enoyl-CoA hydratase/carnithine racemase